MVCILSKPNTSMSIFDLDQDILTTHVLSLVHPNDLGIFLLSCKTFYANKHEYFRENKYAKQYNETFEDTRNYFSIINDSYICFNRRKLTIKTPLVIDKTKIDNTTCIIQLHRSMKERTTDVYRQHLLDRLQQDYSYTRKQSCESKMDIFFNTKWWLSDVDCYDMYQIVYHVSNRNNRALSKCLESITFVQGDVNSDTLRQLVATLVPITMVPKKTLNDEKINRMIFYVLISYSESIINETSIKWLEPLMLQFIFKLQRDRHGINTCKNIPKYLKQQLLQKYQAFESLIQSLS